MDTNETQNKTNAISLVSFRYKTHATVQSKIISEKQITV